MEYVRSSAGTRCPRRFVGRRCRVKLPQIGQRSQAL